MASDRWHGNLDLVYASDRGQTRLVRHQARSPLKMQRSFYPEGGAICHNAILHTAGGIVGGDRLSIGASLRSGSRALLTTVAASKVYGSRGRSKTVPEGIQAQQALQFDLDARTHLEWLPLETIVFDGAIYRQDVRVNLAPEATFLGWEMVRLGRTARKERFLQGEWRSHLEIWREETPLWIDRQGISGGATSLDSPHGLAGHPVIASLVWVGRAIAPGTIDRVRTSWESRSRQGEAGVTRLMDGLLCRYRGQSTQEARRWFIEVWTLLRQAHWGERASISRLWFAN